MLTYEEMKTELSKYTFFDGWRFTLWNREREGVLLYIEAEVINSYKPDEMTKLRICTWVPPMITKAEFTRWLFWRLKQAVIHEAMEWFKRDGQVVYDPHADVDPSLQDLREYGS